MITLAQCPKRFWYEYILKLTPEKMYPEYGTLGSKAHSVIEHFYKNVTIPCTPEEEFDQLIGRLYEHSFSDIEDHKRNMLTGLMNFLEMEVDRYNDLENKELFIPKYNELYIKSEINEIPFSGRIDAIYQNENGQLIATDYKFTGSNSIGKEQKQQACIYAILLENELKIEFKTFDFWFLRHRNKTIKSVKISEKLINDVTQNVNKCCELSNNLDFPYKPDYLCRFCGYQNLCLTERSEMMTKGE
jgi:RecB family exonuclease